MGTDIHSIVQINVGDRWEYIGSGPTDDVGDLILQDRNYNLFSILAGVRNGFGFAGYAIASPVVPIAEPRGLPHPIGSLPFNQPIDGLFGDHSFSWLTLKELDSFPWDESRMRIGVIPASEYDKFIEDNEDRSRSPDRWSGGVDGPNITTLEEVDFLFYRRTNNLLTKREIYVRVNWVQPHTVICHRFHSFVLPWMRRLAVDHCCSSSNIRLVFGFDS